MTRRPSGARSDVTAAPATRRTSASSRISASLRATRTSGNLLRITSTFAGSGSYTHFRVPPAPARPSHMPNTWPWSRLVAAKTNSPGSTTGAGTGSGAYAAPLAVLAALIGLPALMPSPPP